MAHCAGGILAGRLLRRFRNRRLRLRWLRLSTVLHNEYRSHF